MYTLGIKERIDEWRALRKINIDWSALGEQKVCSQLKLLKKLTMRGWSIFEKLKNDRGIGEAREREREKLGWMESGGTANSSARVTQIDLQLVCTKFRRESHELEKLFNWKVHVERKFQKHGAIEK